MRILEPTIEIIGQADILLEKPETPFRVDVLGGCYHIHSPKEESNLSDLVIIHPERPKNHQSVLTYVWHIR